jgi:predicted small secreted protein
MKAPSDRSGGAVFMPANEACSSARQSTRQKHAAIVVEGTKGRVDMKSKLITALLVGTCMALAACNTVRGAATDVGSAANCTENAMHGGRC